MSPMIVAPLRPGLGGGGDGHRGDDNDRLKTLVIVASLRKGLAVALCALLGLAKGLDGGCVPCLTLFWLWR